MRYRMAAPMRPNRMNHARGGNSMRKYLFLHCVAAFLSVGVLAAPALSQMGGQDKSKRPSPPAKARSEEHTSELQSPYDLVCRLLLEKKNNTVNHLVHKDLLNLVRARQ